MEVLLPLVMALLIDQGISSGQMPLVVRYGVLMLVAAFLSLAFGVLSSRFAARASAGYACNLRESIFAKVQTFSFSNIDKFSTAGLVTRMTTDVTNLQNAFLMILRIGIRSPLMLLASLVLCLLISPRLSLISWWPWWCWWWPWGSSWRSPCPCSRRSLTGTTTSTPASRRTSPPSGW